MALYSTVPMNRYGKISKLVCAVLFTRIRDVKDMYSKLYSNLQKLNSTITMRLMLKVFLGSIVVLITALPIILNVSADGASDNVIPFIEILNITKDQIFHTSPIIVNGTAWDNVGLSNVTVIVGGVTHELTISGDTTWTWTSEQIHLEKGSNEIIARATDNSSNSNQISVSVKYIPVISIESHQEGEEVKTSSITVSGNVSDDVKNVTVTIGSDTREVNITGSPTWTWTSGSRQLALGWNKITANATDNSGNYNETFVNVKYTRPGTNGGGSSGGASGGSGENFSNINVIEKYDQPIYKDVMTSYKFINPKNPIIFVNITGNVNYDGITTMVETLKGTSSIVKSTATGDVYMNINIWVGTSGFAIPKNIKGAVIRFRVENSWIDDLSNENIKLQRWDGSKWVTLETSEISKDSTFTYFEANTDSFSPFAITSLKKKSSLNGVMFSQEKTSTEKTKKSDGNKAQGDQPESNKPDVLMNWFIISGIFVLVGLIIEVLRIKKK